MEQRLPENKAMKKTQACTHRLATIIPLLQTSFDSWCVDGNSWSVCVCTQDMKLNRNEIEHDMKKKWQ